MNITMICLSLLPLHACAMGNIAFTGYRSYNSTLTGNSLMLTTGPSVVRCLTLCAGYQHTSSTDCYAARYNGATGDCEIMSHGSTDEVNWLADNQWKVFVRQCEAGWTMFDVSCYQLFSINTTWDDARSACEQVNASLASITSKEEDNFINAFIDGTSDTIWVGGTDRQVEGRWKWVSGDEWIYENFVSEGNGDTLGIRHNQGWIDEIGRNPYFYLCERLMSVIVL
ncbi:snaclec A9-like [Mya arenaria]|uniref:snaclec A9-like n=1 Tax=Mya arenaria TaxID=6604 RepID=UPI0022E55A8D|nr:snaclec A9-like [Mya arenaria]